MKQNYREGNLVFEFSGFEKAERFDEKGKNAYGLKAVDFIAEAKEQDIYLEVKDYQNPKAPASRRKEDFDMLIDAGKSEKSFYAIEMGTKIKDSLLRQYASGKKLNKPVKYLLLINLDRLGERERGMLKARISGHIPTGLERNRYPHFPGISFELVNADQLKNYGIICESANNSGEIPVVAGEFSTEE
jgi:hypothetical protein